MFHFIDTVQNTSGAPVVGASVTVYFTGTQTKASLYSDQGVTGIANPVTTASPNGQFDFYVASGRYDLVVSGSGVTSFTQSDVPIFDSSPSINTVTFSATPTFDATKGNPEITLTGNVTSSTLTGLFVGQIITFTVIQDNVGGHTFAWPTQCKGATIVDATAGAKTVQAFIYDGTNCNAISVGTTD